jgi:hypothetical protein
MKIPNYRQWKTIPITHPKGAEYYDNGQFYKVGRFGFLYRLGTCGWIKSTHDKDDLLHIKKGYIKDKYDIAAENHKKPSTARQMPHWLPGDIDLALKLLKNGMSARNVAVEINRSYSAVLMKLAALNISIRKIKKGDV